MDGLILMSKDEYLYYYYMYLSSRKLVPLRTVNSKVYKRRSFQVKFEVSYHFNGSYSTQFCCEVENVFFFYCQCRYTSLNLSLWVV